MSTSFPKSLLAVAVGAVLFSMVLFSCDKKEKEKPVTNEADCNDSRGSIDLLTAIEHTNLHQNYIPTNWRSASSGVWYDIDTIQRYVCRIKELISADTSELKALAGYEWKFGIGFGGKRKKDGKNFGLMTMFMPVLVSTDSSRFVIDVFTARKHVDNHDREEAPRPSAGKDTFYQYRAIYNNQFLTLQKVLKTKGNCPGPDCIIFDEGNMFP
jgi:hypothetical protein